MITYPVRIGEAFDDQVFSISPIYYAEGTSRFEVLHNCFHGFCVLARWIFGKVAYNGCGKGNIWLGLYY